MKTHDDNTAEPTRRAWLIAAALAAAVGAAFFALVSGRMIAAWRSLHVNDPWRSPALTALRAKLAERGEDEPLTDDIRQLDLALRERYFRAKRILDGGVYLLVAAAAVFLVGLKAALSFRKAIPRPPPARDARRQDATTARIAQLLLGGIVLVLLVAGSVRAWPDWFAAQGPAVTANGDDGRTSRAEPPVTTQEADDGYPSQDQIARNWPGFRGPGGSGVSAYANVPATWDGPAGRNILWKARVPLTGYSSPIVWQDRVFLTGSDGKTREVYCFAAANGELLWRRKVATGKGTAPAGDSEYEDELMHAAPTPATDGRRVYAIFGNGDVAAIDYAGTVVWTRNLGQPAVEYGYASSLAMHEGRLLIQYDQKGRADLIALDATTGRQVWKTPRDVGVSWSSPIVVRTPKGPQAILASDCWVISYNPADGKEIWRANCLSGDEIGSSPIYADGMVFVAYEDEFLSAIPADRTGDVTKEILWQGEYGLPKYTSPVSDAARVYLQDGAGIVTCYDAGTGKVLWDFELGGGGYPSPSLAADRLYCLDDEGVMYVLRLAGARKPALLATNELGEACSATPAFADGRIYIRGEKHLFCIAEKGP
jgi:outer membrane protein assembly factor BamB